MHDAVTELKIKAELLRKHIDAGEPSAIARLRALPGLKRAEDERLREGAADLRHRDCLDVIAAEWGFANYADAKAALSGSAEAQDFGTLLYPRGKGPSLNRWYSNYDEAVRDREIVNGYLIGYKRQFLVVDRDYIESLDLDPDDPDWAEMAWDWARPANLAARARLYAKRVAAL